MELLIRKVENGGLVLEVPEELLTRLSGFSQSGEAKLADLESEGTKEAIQKY